MLKKFVKEYFTFSRKERAGIYILLTIIFICIMLPFLFPFFIHPKKYDPGEFAGEISKLKRAEDSSANENPGQAANYRMYNNNAYRKNHYPSSQNITGELFYFDPNTLTPMEWKRLGIRDKTISTIGKYLSKGGHFTKPEDIGKIWGLQAEQVNKLIPYVRIKERNNNPYTYSQRTTYVPFHKIEQKPFDINLADSAMLDSLPGIGSHLARRILQFREKLGGFISVDQVKETYALPDSTFILIKPRLFVKAEVKKININNCTVDQLKVHPYIRFALANAIIQYRNQHGQFASTDELKNIMIMTDEIHHKITPYLTVK